jgi:hypothetical protein
MSIPDEHCRFASIFERKALLPIFTLIGDMRAAASAFAREPQAKAQSGFRIRAGTRNLALNRDSNRIRVDMESALGLATA